MEKRKNQITTYAIIGILILVFGFYSSTMQYAYALSFTNWTTTGHFNVGGGSYNSGNNSWYFVSDNNNTMIRVIDNTTSIAQSIPTTCGDSTNNKVINSITGSKKYIAILCRNGGLESSLIIQSVDQPGIRQDAENVGSGFDDELFAMLEWIGGAKLFLLDITSGGGWNIYMFDLTKINNTGINMQQGRFAYGNGCLGGTIDGVIVESKNELWLSCQNNLADPSIVIVDLNTMAQSGSALTYDAGSLYSIGIDYNPNTGKIYVVSELGGHRLIDVTTRTLVTPGGTGLSCVPADVAINPNTNQAFVICPSSDTVLLVDIARPDIPTSNSVISTFTTQDFGVVSMLGLNNYPQIKWEGTRQTAYLSYGYVPSETTVKNYLTFYKDTTSAPAGTPGEEFCNIEGNEDILICRLGGDGTLGSAGAFVIGDTTSGTGILGIGCSIGLVDCIADSDPKTNGLGLLIFIASIFVIMGMFFRSIGAENTFHLPIFVWIIIIISLSAFFTITGLIDPVFLILSIIALIALGAPKIISIVRGTTFGGGSSE